MPVQGDALDAKFTMKPGALQTIERVNQLWLDDAFVQHLDYLEGRSGGHRLFLSFKDARHLDFSRQNLARAEMVAARLSHARFVSTCLARSNLFGADFERADMRECDLERADLRGGNLSFANLENANLQEADVRNGFILIQDKDGNLVPIKSGTTEIEGVNLSGANLSGARH